MGEVKKTGADAPRAAPPPLPPQTDEAAAPVAPPPAVIVDVTLPFAEGAGDVSADLKKRLDSDVIDRMKKDADARLQVRAYATSADSNSSDARRISLSRALAVRGYLLDKGIKANRIDVHALGSETEVKPVDRVDLSFVK